MSGCAGDGEETMIYVLLYMAVFAITFVPIVVVGVWLTNRYYDNKMERFLEENFDENYS